jgi:hypothetical protein
MVQIRHAKCASLHIPRIYSFGENYKNSAKGHQKPTIAVLLDVMESSFPLLYVLVQTNIMQQYLYA